MEVLQYRCGSTEIDKQVEEAAKLGLANVHQLLQILSEQDQQQQAGISSPGGHHQHHHDHQQTLRPEGSAAASSAIANFRKVSSLLSRTGHARFRRGPRGQTSSLAGLEYAFIECPNTFRSEPHHQSGGASSSSAAGYELAIFPPPPPPHQQHQQHHHIRHQTALAAAIYRKVEAAAAHQRQRLQQHQKLEAELALAKQLGLENSVTSRSFMSSLSMEASDHKGIYGLPPLQTSSSPLRRKCTGKHDELGGSVKCASLKCHCSKRRKLRLKRTIQVPAISNKLADIPPDDYSWRKYGQKPIKGSPHPRGYYKCSSMRGCPARKHVERSLEDPTMLIVTYEGEHNHTRSNNNSTTATNNNSNNNSPGGGGGGGGGSGGASPAPPVGGLVAHS